MSVGSRVTLRSGLDASSSSGSSSAGLSGAAEPAVVAGATGAWVIRGGATRGADVRTGGALVVVGRGEVEREVVGVVEAGDELDDLVVVLSAAGAEVSVDSTGC